VIERAHEPPRPNEGTGREPSPAMLQHEPKTPIEERVRLVEERISEPDLRDRETKALFERYHDEAPRTHERHRNWGGFFVVLLVLLVLAWMLFFALDLGHAEAPRDPERWTARGLRFDHHTELIRQGREIALQRFAS